MKVFWTDDFEGHWPVGTAAVVVAPTKRKARTMLDAELKKGGLPGMEGATLHEIDTNTPEAVIIDDGDY